MKRIHATSFHDDMEPAPADFDDIYIRIGWQSIEQHYQVHAIKVARWIEERGRERLRVLRAAHLSENRRKRYVMGRTLTAVGAKGRGR